MSEEKIFRSYFQRIQILGSVTGPVEKQGIMTEGGGGRVAEQSCSPHGTLEVKKQEGGRAR